MPDTINWEAKYLEQIEARTELRADIARLETKVDRLDGKIDQQGKDLEEKIDKAVAPVNRLMWLTLAAVLAGLVKLFLFSPHP